MLSRAADSVYWMSRYVERAENVARFIDVNHNMMLDAGDTSHEQWSPLVYTTGDHEDFQQRYGEFSRHNVLQFLCFDVKNSNSIISCVQGARGNARSIREIISSTMWEEINKFHHMVQRESTNSEVLDQPYSFCNQVKLTCHLLEGVTDATMSHGEPWNFYRIGKFIERADKTSRIVDVQYFNLLPDPQDVGTSLDVVRWSSLLASASALEMYRRVHGRIVPNQVADLLILDRYFPRSMHFCIINAQDSLRAITGTDAGTFRSKVEQQMGRLRSEMDYTGIRDIIETGLHEYIDQFQGRLNDLGEAIFDEFFAVKPVEQVSVVAQMGQ